MASDMRALSSCSAIASPGCGDTSRPALRKPNPSSFRRPLHTHRKTTARADKRSGMDWGSNREPAPLAAPSVRPPPPPAPLTPDQNLFDPEVSKRAILGGLLAATALGSVRWLYTKVLFNPGDLQADKYGVQYVTTKGGNKVAVYRDARNRLWMVDQAGDVFMDSGDPDVGVFAVDKSGNITNYWEDEGQTKSQSVGNIRDLREVRTKEFGDTVFFPEVGGSRIPADVYARQSGLPKGTEAYPPFMEDRLLTPEERAQVYSEQLRMDELPPQVVQRLRSR